MESASFPVSPTETFAHILGAEFIWLERFKGGFPAAFPLFSPEHMKSHIAQYEQEMELKIASFQESEWAENLEIKNMKGDVYLHSRADILTHLFNHASYHRGQISSKLREAGFAPKATDFILFCRRQPQGSGMSNAS